MTKKVLLIGGGTGGHIIPLKNLAEELRKKKCQVEIIVSDSPLDRQIAQENFIDLKRKNPAKKEPPASSRKAGGQLKIHYFQTDKIRRYFSWKNFFAPFRILKSIFSAKKLLAEIKPDIVFFKGGFVGFPFLMALIFSNFRGKIYGHESDIETGKLTKLLEQVADKVFYSFGEPPYPLFFSAENSATCPPKLQINPPQSPLVRGEVCNHDLSTEYLAKVEKIPSNTRSPENSGLGEGANKNKLLVFGGSQGAQFINELIRDNLAELTKKFEVFLITGLGKSINSPLIRTSVSAKATTDREGISFQQIEMLSASELSQKIKESDLIISRAGANSLFEIISAKKPSLIIPLPSAAKNHQEKNAQFFAKKGLCYVFHQNKNHDFLKTLEICFADKKLRENLQKSTIQNSAKKIAHEIIQ